MIPTTVSFSIEQDVYLPGDPPPTGPVAEGTPPPRSPVLYGADFAGEITIRIPTPKDRMIVIPTKTSRMVAQLGRIDDASDAPVSSWHFANAVIFFAELGQGIPDWLKGEGAGTQKAIAAIEHAHKRAIEEIEREKKSDAPVGENSLPTS